VSEIMIANTFANMVCDLSFAGKKTSSLGNLTATKEEG
jgi:hypothetical protein